MRGGHRPADPLPVGLEERSAWQKGWGQSGCGNPWRASNSLTWTAPGQTQTKSQRAGRSASSSYELIATSGVFGWCFAMRGGAQLRRSSKKFLGSIGLPPCLLVFVHVGGATTKIYAGWRLGVLFVARLYEWVCVGVGALLCAPARVRLFVCTRFPDVWVCLFMWMGARAGLGQARTCTKGGSIPAGVGAGVGVYWVLSAGHQGARGREGRLRTFAEGVCWRVHA